MIAPDPKAAAPLPGLSRYIYGTTRLGDSSLPFESRVAIARAALEAGVSLHTSHTYGDALQVLRAAFDQDRSHIPSFIVKIGWDSVQQVREVITQNLEPLGLDHLPVGQLCLGGGLAEEFRTGGPACAGLRQLKEKGLVGKFVLEVWPWTSEVPVAALKGGFAEGLIDGYIFYLNPLQRFASNELWDLLRERDETIVAMRTVAGGSLSRLQEQGPEYLKTRAAEIAPVYERSGCRTWTEFCVRFSLGLPQVVSTVGATARLENLQELLSAVEAAVPLPTDIQAEVIGLQRRWAEEHDRHAAPWSM
jgi:aryl-alcohol dehydrogenase-like predicted oxidoreductase